MPAARAFSIEGCERVEVDGGENDGRGLEQDGVVHLALLQVGLVVGVERDDLVAHAAPGTSRWPRPTRSGTRPAVSAPCSRSCPWTRRRRASRDRSRPPRGSWSEVCVGDSWTSPLLFDAAGPFGLVSWAVPSWASPVIMRTTSSGLVFARATSPATTPWRITTMRSATWKAWAMMWVMMMTPMPWAAMRLDHLEAAPRLLDAEGREGLVEQHQLAAPVDEAVEFDRLALAAGEMLDIGAQATGCGFRHWPWPRPRRPPSRLPAGPECRSTASRSRGP